MVWLQQLSTGNCSRVADLPTRTIGGIEPVELSDEQVSLDGWTYRNSGPVALCHNHRWKAGNARGRALADHRASPFGVYLHRNWFDGLCSRQITNSSGDVGPASADSSNTFLRLHRSCERHVSVGPHGQPDHAQLRFTTNSRCKLPARTKNFRRARAGFSDIVF